MHFEHAKFSLKSKNSVNINKDGVVVLLEDFQPIFVPNDEEVDFLKDKWGYEYPNFKELSNIIENSHNIISLWDQIGSSPDYWSKTLLDKNSKIVVIIEQAGGNYQNPLVAGVKNTKFELSNLIWEAWGQNIVVDKIIYDTYLEVANINIVEFLKEFEEKPVYLTKIARWYLEELPADFRKRVIMHSMLKN